MTTIRHNTTDGYTLTTRWLTPALDASMPRINVEQIDHYDRADEHQSTTITLETR